MAQPLVFDREAKQRVIGLMREGVSRTKACEAVGITIRTFKEQIARDEWFAEQIEHLEARRVDRATRALDRQVRKGNMDAIKFFLTNREKDEWANVQRIEHTGQGGGPIAVATTTRLALEGLLRQPELAARFGDFVDAELVPEPNELGPGDGG